MAAERVCPVCGHKENEYTYFCTECGAKTIESSEAVHTEKSNEIKVDSVKENIYKKHVQDNNTASVVRTKDEGTNEAEVSKENTKEKKQPKKQLKFYIAIALAVLFIIILLISVFIKKNWNSSNDAGISDDGRAVKDEGGWSASAETGTYPHIHDNVNLLEDDQASFIENAINESINACGINIMLIIDDDLTDMPVQEYADTKCEELIENGAGYIILLDMESKTVYVSTGGNVIDDSQINQILNQAIFYMTESEYSTGLALIIEQMQECYIDINQSTYKNDDSAEEGIHRYELIVSDTTWTEAYNICLSKGGYLVRINSDEEYQAILQQIEEQGKRNIKFWIGGRRGPDTGSDYKWIYEDGKYGSEVLNTDEKYSSYWLENEPSYLDKSTNIEEACMNIVYLEKEQRWVWNDVPDDILAAASFYEGSIGYVCEYDN